MRTCARIVTLCCIGIGAWSAPAHAQDAGTVGLTVGFPASVGVIWQISDRVAVRPEVSVETGSSESTVTFGFLGELETERTRTELHEVGAGASVLLFLHRRDDLSLYVAPRYLYVRGASTRSVTASSPGNGADPAREEWDGHAFSGSFGMRFDVSRQFGVLGEVGLAHERSRYAPESFDELDLAMEATRTGIRSGVGVVLSF